MATNPKMAGQMGVEPTNVYQTLVCYCKCLLYIFMILISFYELPPHV